jgi:hypothetical protein
MLASKWTVPAERMKGKRVHRVPLPTAPSLSSKKYKSVSAAIIFFEGRWAKLPPFAR